MPRAHRKVIQVSAVCISVIGVLMLMELGFAWWGQGPLVAGKRIDYWINQLHQQPYDRQVVALDHLKAFGPGSASFLIKAIENEHSRAERSRKYYVPVWTKLPDVIKRRLPWPEPYEVGKREFISALCEIAPNDPSAVVVAISALGDRENGVRFCAASGLSRMRTGLESKVVPALAHSLTNDSAGNVRGSAAFSLSEIGKQARTALPALIAALDDTESEVRWTVAKAIGTLAKGDAHAIAVVEKKLGDPDAVARCYLAQAHFKLTGNPEPAVGILVSVVESGSNNDRLVAASILAAFGFEAKAALPALRLSVDDAEIGVSLFSAHALWAIGRDTTRALPALRNALLNGDRYYQIRASEFLGRIGSSASPVVPDLLKTTAESDLLIRRGAVVALGKIGARATSAVPRLTDLADNDLAPSVQAAAKKSLEQINAAGTGAETPQ